MRKPKGKGQSAKGKRAPAIKEGASFVVDRGMDNRLVEISFVAWLTPDHARALAQRLIEQAEWRA